MRSYLPILLATLLISFAPYSSFLNFSLLLAFLASAVTCFIPCPLIIIPCLPCFPSPSPAPSLPSIHTPFLNHSLSLLLVFLAAVVTSFALCPFLIIPCLNSCLPLSTLSSILISFIPYSSFLHFSLLLTFLFSVVTSLIPRSFLIIPCLPSFPFPPSPSIPSFPTLQSSSLFATCPSCFSCNRRHSLSLPNYPLSTLSSLLNPLLLFLQSLLLNHSLSLLLAFLAFVVPSFITSSFF